MYTSIKMKDVGMVPCQRLLKQEDTARRIDSMQQSSTTSKVGCGRLLHAVNPRSVLVYHGLQSNQFIGRPVEEKSDDNVEEDDG